MKQIKENYYIITGGPGSGKTSLLAELERRGYGCVPEVGRKIIREQLSRNGTALPWQDRKAYSEFMLHYSIEDYRSRMDWEGIQFFDRGIPDVLGYQRLIGLAPVEGLLEACKNFRYNPIVFILPAWLEIYENDPERKQDFREAVATYDRMYAVYNELGYTLVEVPKGNLELRAEFILERTQSTE